MLNSAPLLANLLTYSSNEAIVW